MATGDYYCGICGAPGGHGNLQCPRMQARDPFPQYVPYAFPQPYGTQPVVDHGAKLDRIIELLEQLVETGIKTYEQ